MNNTMKATLCKTENGFIFDITHTDINGKNEEVMKSYVFDLDRSFPDDFTKWISYELGFPKPKKEA